VSSWELEHGEHGIAECCRVWCIYLIYWLVTGIYDIRYTIDILLIISYHLSCCTVLYRFWNAEIPPSMVDTMHSGNEWRPGDPAVRILKPLLSTSMEAAPWTAAPKGCNVDVSRF
jgi:hypothetical protein